MSHYTNICTLHPLFFNSHTFLALLLNKNERGSWQGGKLESVSTAFRREAGLHPSPADRKVNTERQATTGVSSLESSYLTYNPN